MLQRTLAALIYRHPFLATLALRTRRIEDSSQPTAWTDGTQVAVNPSWFASLSDEHRVTVLAHECYHIALAHHLRRGNRDPGRWNVACDYAVNYLLNLDGMPLPSGVLHDPSFGDASAETIYKKLSQIPDPSTGSASSSAGSSATAAPPPPSSASPQSPAGSSESSFRLESSLGEVRDLPGPAPQSEGELADRLAEHAVLIAALAQQARASGGLSAGGARAEAIATRRPALDWRRLLAEFLSGRAADDWTWSRPNHRYTQLGLYMPSLLSSAPDSIGFVVDTSGSVPPGALEAIASELSSYLLAYPETPLRVV
ncbi:MAG: metallopeptidase domain containing protein, partial [Acidobacteriota bacterium]|nr:metallopeptidase domain containing protein [Acidobacteriota bacterium]